MNALVRSPAPRDLSLAALLAATSPTVAQQATLRQYKRRVWLPLLVALALIGGWSVWAPLSGAIVANGQVQAEFGRKVVQHQEGGIVRELLVRPGQLVKRGDALLVVGDVRSESAFELLRKQLSAEALRAARARAELELAEQVDWPSSASPADELLQRERQLFDARRTTLQEQLAAMRAQARDAQARVAALAEQLASSSRSAALARDEVALHRPLVESGYVQKTRLIPLERNAAELAARVDAARGQMAEARMQQGSLANAMAQARGAYQQRAGDELKEAVARMREYEERLRPGNDVVERQTVRAPVDGVVMALRVSAAGTAVGPREPLLELAPSGESLVVEVPIEPRDIDHVRVDGAADVRLAAFDPRTTPLLPGRVSALSADAMTDPSSHRSTYVAQIEVSAEELSRHPRLSLRAGMPAEVFITTPPRSLLAYLAEPLGLFALRAAREP